MKLFQHHETTTAAKLLIEIERMQEIKRILNSIIKHPPRTDFSLMKMIGKIKWELLCSLQPFHPPPIFDEWSNFSLFFFFPFILPVEGSCLLKLEKAPSFNVSFTSVAFIILRY